MRKAYTLIEIIFVIVILGILAAVAIPKFTLFKQQAEVNNVIHAITDINGSGGKSSFLNATELNGESIRDLEISDLYKFQSPRWTLSSTWQRSDALYSSVDGEMQIRFRLSKRSLGGNPPGTVFIETIHCNNIYTELFREKGYPRICTEYYAYKIYLGVEP